MNDLPPLPDGFTLDAPSSTTLPPLPKGFTLDAPATKTPMPPEAYTPGQRAYSGLFASSVIGPLQLAAHGAAYATGADWAKNAAENMDSLSNAYAKYQGEAKQQAGLKPDDIDWANTAGEIAAPINWAPAGGGNILSQGIRAGLVQGAVQPVATHPGEGGDYASQKAGQLAMGTGAGIAGAGAAKVAGAIIKPAIRPEAERLIERGVNPTPGQMVGGTFERLENATESVPFVGGPIRNARAETVGQFNRAAANDVLEPLGTTIPSGVKPGNDLANATYDTISAAYDRSVPHMTLSVDQQLAHDLTTVQQAAMSKLPAAEQQMLANIVNEQVVGKIAANGGTAPGDVLHGMLSEIKKEVREYSKSPSWDQKKLAASLNDAQRAIDAAMVRQNAPALTDEFKAANAAYARWLVFAKAAHRSGAAEAQQFTGAQLAAASKAGKSASQTARGNNLMQGLAADAAKVLPSKVADSGTPERSMLAHLLAGATGTATVAAGPAVPLAIGAGWGLTKALYSQPGLRAMRYAMTARPAGAQYVRDILEKYAPTVAARMPQASGSTQQ
jgi:hypothetical protein